MLVLGHKNNPISIGKQTISLKKNKVSPNSAHVQSKLSPNSVQIRSKFNSNSVQIQSKCSQNSVRIRSKFSSNSVQIQSIFNPVQLFTEMFFVVKIAFKLTQIFVGHFLLLFTEQKIVFVLLNTLHIFQAHMKFPPDYPYSPPSVRFITKVWHPNVYEVKSD